MSEQEHDEAGWGGEASRDDDWRKPAAGAPQPLPFGPHVFWHAWECSLLAMLAAFIAAWWLPGYVTWQVAVAGGAALTVTAWFTALSVTRSGVVAGYLAAWGAAITGWICWTYFHGLWHAVVIAVLIIGGSVLGLLAPAVAGHHKEQMSRDEQARREANNELELRRWVKFFAKYGARGTTVIDVRGDAGPIIDITAYPGGIEVRARLGPGTSGQRPITYDQLATCAPEMAVALRRDADGVYFSQPKGPGCSSADFIMHVRPLRSGRQRPTLHLPMENKPLTINKPLGFGTFDNRKEFRQSLREVHLLVGGSTGWGKSSFLTVLIALLAACPDALIWMIDMAGGISSRLWIEPWLRELAPHPVIDWVASTRAEAKLMLETSLKLCDVRSKYSVFEKITPTQETPAVILICDDMGACFGHGKVTGTGADRVSNWGLSQLGSEFTEMARKAAGSMVGAVQRTNVELMGGTGMKAMSDIRIGLHCNDSVDGGRIFPDDPAAAKLLHALTDKGDCLVKRPGGITPVVHLYRIDSADRITDRALWAGPLRPELEQRAADALGDAYAQRWTRPEQLDLLAAWRESSGIPEPGGGDDEDAEPEKYEGWEQIAHLDFDVEDPSKADPRELRMLEIVRQAGPAGLPVRRILARLAAEGKSPDSDRTPARETINRWLAKNELKGLVQRGVKDDHWRWSQQDDFPGRG